MNKLLKNTIYYSIGEICPRIISFILLPIYTHYLSPADYGILSYTNTIILFLFVLGTMSLNSFVLRYYFVWNNEKDRRRLIGSVVAAITVMNILILFLAYVSFPYLIDNFQIQIPWDPYFKLAIISNFLDSFSIIPLVVYRVRQDALNFVSISLGKSLLLVAFNLFFVVYLQIGLIGSYYAMLCTYIPYFFLYIYIIRKYAGLYFDFSIIKEGLKYSSPLIPGALAYLILSVSDRIILEQNVPLSQIGVYNVAFTISLALNIIIQSGYKAIEPEIFQRYGKTGYYNFIKNAQKRFFILIYAMALCICLFSQEIFFFMTSKNFHDGYKLVPLLIVGVVMTGQNVIYSGILSAEKRTKVVGGATFSGAICSILFNLILIPLWGIYAAALSSAISFTVMNTLLFAKMSFEGKSMYKESLSIIIIPVVAYILFYIFPEITWISILIKCGALIVYTFGIIMFFGFDLVDIKNIFYINNKL